MHLMKINIFLNITIIEIIIYNYFTLQKVRGISHHQGFPRPILPNKHPAEENFQHIFNILVKIRQK